MSHPAEDAHRKIASILEEIADRFEKGGEQEKALKEAAWALAYIFISKQSGQLQDFIAKNETPLTPQEVNQLHEHRRNMGIDPNSP